MILEFLNSRFVLIFLLPFTLGTLTVFSFQPYNLSLINFAIIPIFFLLTTYVQKKSKTWYPIILLKQMLISIVCLIASTSANITAIISNVTTTPVDIEVDRFPFLINIEFIATVNQKRKNSIFY